MSEKTYEESWELKDIAERLIERYYYHLGYIQLDNIYFADIIGKKPKKATVMQIGGISSDWVRQLVLKNDSALYCISVWQDEWNELLPEQKQWLVFDALLHIDPHNDGKLNRPDINEFGILVEYEALGPYWRKKTDLPDMFKGDPLPIPVPVLEQDEGETVSFDD